MTNSVLNWLEQTAERYPDKPAYVDENRSITFSQVLLSAKRIGSALSKRVSPGASIAILCGRHVETPVCFLGVVYAGCCYAPLDGQQPKARLQQILDTLQPRYLIVDAENETAAQNLGFQGEILQLEELQKESISEDVLARARRDRIETDPLYIIFTSGSTGKPKGVITAMHSLMCYITAYTKVMGIDHTDVLGNQSPLDYIAAIRDIYLPLKTGASTFIIPKQYFSVPSKLFDVLNEQKITAVGWSVSAFTLPTKMGAFSHAVPQYLKKICFSGSVMPCSCLRVWQTHLPDAKFVNQYGPTEATASCTYYEIKEPVQESDVLPIGVPYENYRVFLLNEQQELAKVGEMGEICVSGPILALGYYNNPELTEQSFVQNPCNTNYPERIYKTGDLGILRQDGLLEFKGRKDRQIKHLGHRVELSEIELAAHKLSTVQDCCALYQKEKEWIYLFYTGSATSKEIAISLRQQLPGFMVPRKLVCLEEMPHLPNGKLDMETLKTYFTEN